MCEILFNARKCNYSEIVPKKSHLKVPANSDSWAIFWCTVRLWEVILALWTSKWVSAFAYERCLLTGG